MIKLNLSKKVLMFFMALVLSGVSPAIGSDFNLTLDSSAAQRLSPQEKDAVQRFFTDVEGKLPESVKDAIGPKIKIGFTSIEQDWQKRCQWNQIMGVRLGSVDGNWIAIEQDLLPSILLGNSNSSKNGCGYANAYQFAIAVVLHQIAVRYDEITGISQDPQVATLLGEAEIGGILPERRVGEEISARTPDVSEFENAQEGFAVNFERYAMDPEYDCRRPTMAHLLSSRLNWTPLRERKCQINTVVPLSQEEVNDAVVKFVNLDPKRLYQVHYLFASKGEEVMSRWGHAMFRLVFCSPARKEVGPDCLKDISYHIVVSFRANVQDYTVDPVKGLNGDYPSQLYLLSMLEVMREYNTDELRDLVSLPLQLSQEQVVDFLDRSLQVFWEYRGRYQFISNNCATEALNLLKSIVPNRTFQEDVHVVTPVGLFDELKKSGMMDDQVLSDEKKAREQGLFFPSEKERLERAFGGFSEKMGTWTLSQYIGESTAAQRWDCFSKFSQSVDVSARGVLASQFFILESYLVRVHEAEFFKQVVGLLENDDSRKSLDPDGTLLHSIERARAIEDSLSPQRLAPFGYGIAFTTDYRPNLEREATAARTELMQIMQTLKQALENHFPKRYQELVSTAENRKKFAQAMQ